jgi:hypothetical protein
MVPENIMEEYKLKAKPYTLHYFYDKNSIRLFVLDLSGNKIEILFLSKLNGTSIIRFFINKIFLFNEFNVEKLYKPKIDISFPEPPMLFFFICFFITEKMQNNKITTKRIKEKFFDLLKTHKKYLSIDLSDQIKKIWAIGHKIDKIPMKQISIKSLSKVTIPTS